MDPEVRLTVELSGRARTIQELCPGKRAQAPRQQGAQTDRRIRQYQLDGVELACAG